MGGRECSTLIHMGSIACILLTGHNSVVYFNLLQTDGAMNHCSFCRAFCAKAVISLNSVMLWVV